MNEVLIRFRTLGLGGPRVWLRVVDAPEGQPAPPNGATTLQFANGSVFVTALRGGRIPSELLGPATPDGWSPVSAPCDVVVDDTGLHLEPEKTLVMPAPPNVPSEYRAEEVTRNFPIEQMVGHGQEPLGGIARGQDLTTPVAPGRGKSSKGGALAKAWQTMPLPRKVLLVLLPLAFFVCMQAVARRNRQRAELGQSEARASAGSPSASAAVAENPSTTARVEAPLPPPASPLPAAQVPVANEPKKTSTVAKAPAKKTEERLAADAVAAGSYADAISLYDDLAREHPDAASYREAARILRQKIGGPPVR